jgi:DNA-dependent RNA polymerase auxiliary subunit epsilon
MGLLMERIIQQSPMYRSDVFYMFEHSIDQQPHKEATGRAIYLTIDSQTRTRLRDALTGKKH